MTTGIKNYRLRSVSTLPLLVVGDLEARLATSLDEIKAAQRLRFEVFYDECGAQPDEATLQLGRDFDRIDEHCDHLLVIDHTQRRIVGTYRFMLRESAERCGGYYTASEYNIEKIVAYPGEIMELGRSCVHKDYRTRPTMQLLWKGIYAYIQAHNVQICFGCASFPGTDISQFRDVLAFLYHHYLAPDHLRARALPGLFHEMNTKPIESVDTKSIVRQIPTLIKGYLRTGGYIGDGAIIDHQFNTTDVCVIVKRDVIEGRYGHHYGPSLASNAGTSF